MTSVFSLCFRWIVRARAKRARNQSESSQVVKVNASDTLPKTRSTPCLAGVRADQPIDFVVPMSYTSLTDTGTEDDYSESDCATVSSFSDWEAQSARKRKIRRTGFNIIDPRSFQRGLYDEFALNAGYGQQGEVSFILHYNSARQQLVVTILSARDLITTSKIRETLNVAAKVAVLPDSQSKFMTKVQRNNANPTFNEAFTFSVPIEKLDLTAVSITMWHFDKLLRKYFVGQTIMPVKRHGIDSSISSDVTTGQIWSMLHLFIEKDRHPYCGELLLSLSYNPRTITLTVAILKAKNLPLTSSKNEQDSVYVKLSLYVRRKVIRTKKTPCRKKYAEVEFNHKFQIQVVPAALDEMDILIALCERRRAGIPGSKHVIGRIQVGPNCFSEDGVLHWQDMLASPKSTSVQWHALI